MTENHRPIDPAQQITVGPAGSGADVCGQSGWAIQIALDALEKRGGGEVRLKPGTYELIDSVRMRANTALIGEDRQTTILRRKTPLVYSELAMDADVGEKKVTPTDASQFKPGMGVSLKDQKVGWQYSSTPFFIRRIDERGSMRISGYMTADVRAEDGGLVLNHYTMISGYETPHLHIEGLTLDGTVDDPDQVMGTARSAGIYLFRSPDSLIRDVTMNNNPGDGICFGKTSERVVVEDCETSNNGWYGIHPGSHSTYATVRRCEIHNNYSDGLYVCWGIYDSEFTDNHISHNGWGMLRSGICTGHKDTDNLFARNHIHDNAKYGFAFRHKTEANGPHRCTLRENTIENNGSSAEHFAGMKKKLPVHEHHGAGIHVSGMNHGLTLERNLIRETRTGDQALQHYGLWLSQGVSDVTLDGNTFDGHPEGTIRDEAGALGQPASAA